MNAEKGSEIEQTFLFSKETTAVIKTKNAVTETSNSEKGIEDGTASKNNVDVNECIVIPAKENIEIPIWRNRKICIHKALIPLRIAQFLWFASGSICSPFFSLILIHRGLKLNEFSSVFSMVFLVQLTVAYISGIVADKLGNAKPVLLFEAIATLTSIVGLLLSPNARDETCLEQDFTMKCFSALNYTPVLENCKHVCSTNNSNNVTTEYSYKNNYDSIESSKRVYALSSNESLEEAFYSNDTFIFCNEMCFCIDEFSKICTSELKIWFKLLYSFLILSFFSFWSTSYRFLDFACLNVAKEFNSDFGNERLYGYLGSLVASLLCNLALNLGETGTRGYYDNVFWLAVALYIVAAVSVWNIRVVRLPPGINFIKKTLNLLTDIEILSVIVIAFVAGIAYTFHDFYDIWFLDSLKASKTLIGINILCFPIYGIPMYFSSKWWLKRLGIRRVMIISLLGYTISGISYSFLHYPWLSLIIELTRPFSFHLFWVATVVRCHKIAPQGFGATLNALAGTFHFGIGRSFSVSVGGYLISIFGIRATYRILAGFCLTSSILYSIFCYIRHVYSIEDYRKRSKDPEEMESMRENGP